MRLGFELAEKQFSARGLCQGTTLVVPSGLQSALIALPSRHFLSAEEPALSEVERAGAQLLLLERSVVKKIPPFRMLFKSGFHKTTG